MNSSEDFLMATNQPKQYASLDEIRLMLGVSENTLRYNETFPKGIKIGRRVVYKLTEVNQWLESNRMAQ
ncbi:helix-turn-helix transcriptional regulator [Gilliamella sp. wkB178]|uniref:helix-turn-helix transcriptional regulator n=1 Tax=Gilliamella sp. wkB178 TaxID=3120259 RepID=UPI00159EE3E9|nr:helix-turn-helix domain-containing protein [Gilliamella apicola]